MQSSKLCFLARHFPNQEGMGCDNTIQAGYKDLVQMGQFFKVRNETKEVGEREKKLKAWS